MVREQPLDCILSDLLMPEVDGLAFLLAHHPGSPGELLHLADQALYGAKSQGRNRHVIFSSSAFCSP